MINIEKLQKLQKLQKLYKLYKLKLYSFVKSPDLTKKQCCIYIIGPCKLLQINTRIIS